MIFLRKFRKKVLKIVGENFIENYYYKIEVVFIIVEHVY